MTKFEDHISMLKANNWNVKSSDVPGTLPENVRQRYSWLPEEVVKFVARVEYAVSSDEKAWFLNCLEYRGETDSAFSWDEWEKQSLEAAEGDDDLEAEVRRFWDSHFPILLSVRDGYSYLAVERDSGMIVGGDAPEFEEAETVCRSFDELLKKVGDPNGPARKYTG